MNSIQSSIASALWESIGATAGCFDVPEDVTLVEVLFLAAINRTTAIILSPRCLMYFTGDSSNLCGRNLHVPANFVPLESTLLLEFSSQNMVAL